MVQVKREPFDFKAAAAAAAERLGKVIETRYVVFEVTPEWTDSGYYGEQRHPAKYIRVGSFRNLRAVSKWEDEHEPDAGKHFEVYEEELRERTVREWFRGKKIK